jgi:branched-chain amino acid transport system ATP-binding protein
MRLLEVAHVTRSFGGNLALDDVSFEMSVDALAIVGPNGAGKTTLLNVIAGVLHPSKVKVPGNGRERKAARQKEKKARIQFLGKNITRLPPWQVARLGMVKTYQLVRPFRSLTVEENLELFARLRSGLFAKLRGEVGIDRMRRGLGGAFELVSKWRRGVDVERVRAWLGAQFDRIAKLRRGADVDQILAATGLTEVRGLPSGLLPFGLLKRLELAKALAASPNLLLLDEPIGGLSRSEAEGLIATLLQLKAAGTRMVVVEHRLGEILPVVDRVLALDHGRVIFDGTRESFFDDPAVRTAYLGRADA